jgi:hypothetical protein
MAALQRQKFGDRRGRQPCAAEPARRWRATLSTLSLIAGKTMILSRWTFLCGSIAMTMIHAIDARRSTHS